MSWIDGISFVAVIVTLMLVGLWASLHVRREQEYLWANRSLSFIALTATLVMVELNPSTLVAFSSMGYAAGFWALTLPLIFLIGLSFYALSVARKWKAYDGHSVAGFFSQRYSKGTGRFASLALITAMLGFSATYVKSATLIFAPLLPTLPPWLISTLLVVAVLLITWRGGLVSVIATDLLSLVMVIIFLVLCVVFSKIDIAFDHQAIAAGREVLPLRFVVSLIVLTMFTYILAPWYGQKIFAARSQRTAFAAVATAAVLVFLIYTAAILAAAYLPHHTTSLAHAEEAFPYLLSKLIPSGWKGFGYALLFAATATTLGGLWNALTSMAIADFFSPTQSSSWRARGLTLLFAATSLVAGLTLVDRVLDKMILANVPIAALSFALLGGFYWKGATTAGAWASMTVGLIWGVGCYGLFGLDYTWYWAMYGIPMIFLSGITVSVLTAPEAQVSAS